MTPLRPLVTLLAPLVLLAAPQWAAADFAMTLSGTYLGLNEDPRIGLTYSSDRFDGTDEFLNDLPNLFRVDRLAGGTFTATLRIPSTVAPDPGSDPTYAFYFFDPGKVGVTFTLFDAAGAVVHRGASGPSTIGAGIVQDNLNSLLDSVQLETGAFETDTSVSGLRTPPLLGGETDLYGGGGVLFSSNNLSILNGLAIPTDTATYRRFNGAVFVASAGVDTFSPDGQLFTEVLSGVSYRITNVAVTPVPEPPSVVLAIAGGLTILAFARRRSAG